MSKQHIVYSHANCDDGFGAALAAWYKFKDSAYYNFCGYNGKIPNPPAEVNNIWIFDFSFPREVIEGWEDDGYRVEIHDHHKTAMEALADLRCTCKKFNMDKSGAVMAWERLHPSAEIPLLLKYVQDRDLWKKELPYHEEIIALIQSYPKDFEVWAELMIEFSIRPIKELAKRGQDILRYKDSMITNIVNKYEIRDVIGYSVPVVNTPNFQSEVGNRLCLEHPEYPFSASYYDIDEHTRQWSLRSVGTFDVAAIAKTQGGGGHLNAAGFIERK